jgi:hypothetical protein
MKTWVPEVSGQVLAGRTTGTWSRSGTTVTVTETAHGRAVGQAVRLDFTTGGGPTGVYAIATVPGEDSFTVTTASGSGSGDVLVHAVLGGEAGFTASAAGTRARHLAVDLVLPRGLYGYDDGTLEDRTLGVTVEARRVDDAGDPLGDWVVLGSVTLTDRTTTPIRRSYRWPVSPAGRYRVRAWRTDAQDAEAGNGHEVLLAGLRAYLREDQDFGPVTLLAMRMRASNNLSLQASRKVGVVCTRKIPVWTGSGWSAPVASRSIAWAIADATRDAAYGAGLADAALDLEALLALDAVWTARGDRFDGRFETASSWWEAITRIAAAGRARIFMQGGILRCVRDAPADVPVALYSMRNIRRGSFGIDYLLPGSETASRVEVTYFDATTWSQRRVVAKLPGSAGQVPAKLDLFGVTGRDQALREGLYHAATNRYRRRIVRFATEMEGFIPSLLDLIAIQHDMPGWAQHAEAVAWHGPTRTLTLSEPVVFGSGAHYVGLRTRSGGLAGPFGATPGAVPGQVVLDATPDEPVETGSSRERTHVTFGRGEAWRVLARVVSVRPRGPYDVEIEAVVEDPSVHGADEGQTAQPLRPSSLPRRATVPVVSGLIARRLPGNLSRAVLSWQPAAGADSYQIEMAEGADPAAAGITWSRIADTTATDHVVTLLWASRTIVRVRAIGLAAGPWTAAVLGSLIEDMWSASAATPMWTTDPALMWSS